jgi:hypothetical protein
VRWSGDSGENGLTVEVFYVDFGNIEEVNVGDLRVLLPQFISMPAQVVRCSLADVNPSIKQELDCDVFYEGEFLMLYYKFVCVLRARHTGRDNSTTRRDFSIFTDR